MIWHDIPGFTGYKIGRDLNPPPSSSGWLILSLKFSEPRVMKQFISVDKKRPSSSGYWSVFLRQDGKYKNCKIHVLVMRTFRGPCPPGQQVCHNDGNKLNLALSNLRYGTQSTNNRDQLHHGTHYEANRDCCDQGHEFTPENTMRRKARNGNIIRKCRECHRITTARYRARRKEGLTPTTGPIPSRRKD